MAAVLDVIGFTYAASLTDGRIHAAHDDD